MKNIHILPTHQPSRLYLISKTLTLSILSTKHENNIGRHIYITSDETTKCEICWHYNRIFNTISKEESAGYKKIILTTDQDLIKDGVQAIDDEFLEWFVKNPSCEEIEVVYGLYNQMGKKVSNEKVSQNHSQCAWKYKIIIPKEESLSYEDFRKKASKELLEKFDNEASKGSGDGDFDNYFYGNCRYWENKLKEEPKQREMFLMNATTVIDTRNPKQETLEEAANNYSSNKLSKLGFINGYKLAQKRSYSEEEVENIIMKLMSEIHNGDITYVDYVIDFKISPRQWFEEFKKK